MTPETVTVIIDGKPEQRPLSHIDVDDGLYSIGRRRGETFPKHVPVLYEGERMVEGVDGTIFIVREYE